MEAAEVKRGRPSLYMNIKEAAPKVGVSEKTLYNWIEKEYFDEIPRPVRRGRKILFWRSEIERIFKAPETHAA